MRKGAFIFGLIWMPLLVWSQKYIPIPNENVSWKGRVTGESGGSFQTVYQFKTSTGGDTVIGSDTYTKIYNYHDYYLGAFREDTSRHVFFYPRDSLKEFLLCDFNVELGDTITNLYPDTAVKLIVGRIDEDTNRIIDPNYPELGRRWIWLQLDYGGIPITYVWIEGIGSTSGLIEMRYEPRFETSIILECFTIDDIAYVIKSNCTPLNIDDADESTMPVAISNPVIHEIRIFNLPYGVTEYIIRDITGHKMMSGTVDTTSPFIQCDNLISGFYMLQLEGEFNSKSTFHFIKEE